ncbi:MULTISPECIES: hypothetical protein [Sphingomonadales]|nr:MULTISPECIES: hypothetical protein [Sphingomonadaceae]AMG73082.1 Uncharacterized protein SGRAN_0686 [Sphingopyxis granuli]MBB3928145.1 hypothetical protein [Sphingobium jiangsuense]QUT05329.1 hypothetical protein KFK14_20445 [Sphingobium phenoxybenzoativorans]
MMPIAKAMTAALGTLIATTTACAGPGGHGRQASITPTAERPRIVVATVDGFVLRVAATNRTEPAPASFTANHIPVGSGTHIDARLLSRPASTLQETSHAHP